MTKDAALLLLISILTLAKCDVDLKDILIRAAYRLAGDSGTTINRAKLANGFCFTASDGGSKSGCSKQPAGKFCKICWTAI